ncbi:hypothetical protein [Streptomyces sp. NBC_00829]|uniref:hypothetical protein n=1 Tax=Streptomyces sp. NBC_00829 TaxID=2903679 RepID=UPI0038632A4F|nr:hypothetical protein OG293_33205 [Streptomyces sp. NBC_00829]
MLAEGSTPAGSATSHPVIRRLTGGHVVLDPVAGAPAVRCRSTTPHGRWGVVPGTRREQKFPDQLVNLAFASYLMAMAPPFLVASPNNSTGPKYGLEGSEYDITGEPDTF